MKILTFEQFKGFIAPILNEILSFSVNIWYILLALALLIVFIIILLILRKKTDEKSINEILSGLDGPKYKIIGDLLFSNGERTVRIDYLVISDFGIFAITEKNEKGKITGTDSDDYWTLVSNKGKEKMFNPIKQSNTNIKVLKDIFEDYFHFLYIPIIVFSNFAKLKTKTSVDVIHSSKLAGLIKKYNIICISEEEKEIVYSKILSLKI